MPFHQLCAMQQKYSLSAIQERGEKGLAYCTKLIYLYEKLDEWWDHGKIKGTLWVSHPSFPRTCSHFLFLMQSSFSLFCMTLVRWRVDNEPVRIITQNFKLRRHWFLVTVILSTIMFGLNQASECDSQVWCCSTSLALEYMSCSMVQTFETDFTCNSSWKWHWPLFSGGNDCYWCWLSAHRWVLLLIHGASCLVPYRSVLFSSFCQMLHLGVPRKSCGGDVSLSKDDRSVSLWCRKVMSWGGVQG